MSKVTDLLEFRNLWQIHVQSDTELNQLFQLLRVWTFRIQSRLSILLELHHFIQELLKPETSNMLISVNKWLKSTFQHSKYASSHKIID